MTDSAVAGFNLTYAGQMGNRMFPILNELRETDPIHWDERAKCWIVTRHQDILDALWGRVPVSNSKLESVSASVIPPQEWPERLPNLVKYSPHHITNIDPPVHTRMRSLLMRAFSRPVVESMRPYARATVADLMRRMHDAPEVDFTEVALALPGRVILKLLGLPDEIYDRLGVWAHAVILGLGTPNPEPDWVVGVDRAFTELTQAVLPQIEHRRTAPHNPEDFISSLVYARDGSTGLTDDEIVAVLQVTVIAGHDTTANSMTLGVAALAENPAAWQHMRANPKQIMDQVVELMRYSAMSAAQSRLVTKDFDWHGKQIRKGDVLFLMLAAGNRDPRVFTDPEALDVSRRNDQSLTFAPGLHHCIGHLLAKMQLTEFFGSLVQAFEGADVLEDDLRYSNALVFRSVASLRMRFHPNRSSIAAE